MGKKNFCYVLTSPRKLQLTTNGNDLICERCGHPLEVGQAVITKIVTGAYSYYRAHRYHQRCYDAMFIEV